VRDAPARNAVSDFDAVEVPAPPQQQIHAAELDVPERGRAVVVGDAELHHRVRISHFDALDHAFQLEVRDLGVEGDRRVMGRADGRHCNQRRRQNAGCDRVTHG
jgi:hypothetical protein